MPPKGEKYYFVASLAKGLRVLELLAANGDMSASRMAGHLDTSRAASHRFLTTLVIWVMSRRQKRDNFG